MEKLILVDSCIYIRLLRLRMDPAIALLERFQTLDLATCGIVQMEVLRGIRVPRIKETLTEFMGVMIFVASDNRLWAEATELAWRLDRQGWTLPSADLLTAASAIRLGAEVLTLDAHFAKIPGLALTEVPTEWRH